MEPKSEPCLEVQHLLPLYVGADLDPAEMDLVAEHLNGCEECRASNLALLGARERISSLAEASWTLRTPDLWSGVRAGLVQEGLLGRPSISRWQRLRVGGFAAAAALVVSLSVLQFTAPAEPTGAGSRPSASVVPDAGVATALPAPSRRALPAPVRGDIRTVGAGAMPRATRLQLPPSPVDPAEDGLRRAAEGDVHLIDHARPVGLGDVLRPLRGEDGASLVGGLRRP